VDTYDNHTHIPDHRARMDAAARDGGNVAVVSTGWDPGLFSLNRTLARALFPAPDQNTFWGPGLSQGHSDAVRRIPGVKRAVQYTIPREDALAAARDGKAADITGKQAAATVGQCELMFIYDKMFSEYGQKIGQLLITKADVEHPVRHSNLVGTMERLLDWGVIPVINENDAVANEEIVYGDNDSLSAIVARLIHADKLIILTDIDGLYDSNPKTNPDARLIRKVEAITPDIRALARDSGSSLGTGGMITKLQAAELATSAGIETYVINGEPVNNIYSVLEGKNPGTWFKAVQHHVE